MQWKSFSVIKWRWLSWVGVTLVLTGAIWGISLPAYFRTSLRVSVFHPSSIGKQTVEPNLFEKAKEGFNPYSFLEALDELRSEDLLKEAIHRQSFLREEKATPHTETSIQLPQKSVSALRSRFFVDQFRGASLADVSLYGTEFKKDANFLQVFANTYFDRTRNLLQAAGKTSITPDYWHDEPTSKPCPHPHRKSVIAVICFGLLMSCSAHVLIFKHIFGQITKTSTRLFK